MPLDINKIFNIKTVNNIQKFNLDLSKYDDLKTLRADIYELKKKEKIKGIGHKKPNYLPKDNIEKGLTLQDITNKRTLENVKKYNVDVSKFPTLDDLRKYIRYVQTKQYFESHKATVLEQIRNSYYKKKGKSAEI